MGKPQMWIMKITPDESYKTKEIFEGLFLGDNPKNVIGWDGEEEGNFQRFMDHWQSMKNGDVVVIMEGLSKSLGAVLITSEPFEGKGNSIDWFRYRRKAKLIKAFDPPLEHKISTNRDRIMKESGNNAKKIIKEVWNIIKDDYQKI